MKIKPVDVDLFQGDDTPDKESFEKFKPRLKFPKGGEKEDRPRLSDHRYGNDRQMRYGLIK